MRLIIPYAGTIMRSGDHARFMRDVKADACVNCVAVGDFEAAEIESGFSRFYREAIRFWNGLK